MGEYQQGAPSYFCAGNVSCKFLDMGPQRWQHRYEHKERGLVSRKIGSAPGRERQNHWRTLACPYTLRSLFQAWTLSHHIDGNQWPTLDRDGCVHTDSTGINRDQAAHGCRSKQDYQLPLPLQAPMSRMEHCCARRDKAGVPETWRDRILWGYKARPSTWTTRELSMPVSTIRDVQSHFIT